MGFCFFLCGSRLVGVSGNEERVLKSGAVVWAGGGGGGGVWGGGWVWGWGVCGAQVAKWVAFGEKTTRHMWPQ